MKMIRPENTKARHYDHSPFFQKERNQSLFTESNSSFFSPRTLQKNNQSNQIQLKPDDKHDLTATQLSGNPILEKTFDNETTISPFRNSSGEHVKKIQEALIQLGIALNQFGADEQYGTETSNGVKEFQQKANMSKNELDGIVGRKTLGLLDRSLRNNTISADTDIAEDDLILNDPKKKAEDEACIGKPKDKPCSLLDTIGIHIGADDAIERIDKVLSTQLPPVKTPKADYPNIFGSLFRNNDTRPVTDTSDEVKTNFNIVKSFIAKLKTDPSHVRCGTECDGGCRSGSPAYHSNAKGRHIITFCPDFSDHKERTSIVIHECHHASIDKSKDIAYSDTRLIDKLDHKEALRNAASFHLYAALVEDPKSDNMGPKVKDTNKIANATQQKNVDLALAFLQQWFRLVTFDMSRVSTDMDEARQKGFYSEKSRTDLINDIYVKWFGVTPAPSKPTETDVKRAKVIEERSETMNKAFNNPFTIIESATVSEWERGPGKNIQLNKALIDLDINHMVIGLLQELVHATPQISPESEPLFVGTINDLRNDRELAP
jgi:peptidoglycan hydrolase-like protein with peptidoglycan-binding domain